MIGEGCVRVRRGGGEIGVDKPSRAVRAGDILSIVIGARQVVVKVEATGDRRGPAPEAKALYSVIDDRRIAKSDWLAPSDHGAGAP
jgi:ribosome-associated heat shock protein Hsp15